MFRRFKKKVLLATLPALMAVSSAHAAMGNYTINFDYSNLHTSDGSSGPNSVTGQFHFSVDTGGTVPGWYYVNISSFSIEIDGIAAFLDHDIDTARVLVDSVGNINTFDYRSWETTFDDGDFQFTFFGNNIVSWISSDTPTCSNTVNGLRYQLDGIQYDTCGNALVSYEHEMRPIKPSLTPLPSAPTPADFPTPTEVPAPAGLALLGLGILGCLQTRRMRKAA